MARFAQRTPLLLAGFLCSALAISPAAADDRVLKVASYAGGYALAQKESIFDVYTEETGIYIELTETDDGVSAIMPESDGTVLAQVVVLDLQSAQKACADGLLARLTPEEIVSAEKDLTLEEDFVPFGLTPCAIGNSVNSQVITFDLSKHPKSPPASPRDFFDLETYPGKRGLRPDPHTALVLASIATGTAPENVYKTLESAQGVEAAFRMLKTIENEIVWWRTGRQAVDYLATNMVTMTTAFHSWVYHARVTDGRPLGLIWNGQQTELDVWAIPASAGKQSLAANFIRFATDKERMAAQANLMPYGPARKSAFPLIKDEMREHLPNTPEHGAAILWIDHAWWAKHGPPLEKRFAVWVAKSEQS